MTLFRNAFDPSREAVLVTGAGNGIGRAIALALVSEGLRNVFADVNEDRLAVAVQAASRPELAFAWVGDLANREDCDALLVHARKAVGLVTHLCTALLRHDTKPTMRLLSRTKPGIEWERSTSTPLSPGA